MVNAISDKTQDCNLVMKYVQAFCVDCDPEQLKPLLAEQIVNEHTTVEGDHTYKYETTCDRQEYLKVVKEKFFDVTSYIEIYGLKYQALSDGRIKMRLAVVEDKIDPETKKITRWVFRDKTIFSFDKDKDGSREISKLETKAEARIACGWPFKPLRCGVDAISDKTQDCNLVMKYVQAFCVDCDLEQLKPLLAEQIVNEHTTVEGDHTHKYKTTYDRQEYLKVVKEKFFDVTSNIEIYGLKYRTLSDGRVKMHLAVSEDKTDPETKKITRWVFSDKTIFSFDRDSDGSRKISKLETKAEARVA